MHQEQNEELGIWEKKLEELNAINEIKDELWSLRSWFVSDKFEELMQTHEELTEDIKYEYDERFKENDIDVDMEKMNERLIEKTETFKWRLIDKAKMSWEWWFRAVILKDAEIEVIWFSDTTLDYLWKDKNENWNIYLTRDELIAYFKENDEVVLNVIHDIVRIRANPKKKDDWTMTYFPSVIFKKFSLEVLKDKE